jgi:dihydropteroate synthase
LSSTGLSVNSAARSVLIGEMTIDLHRPLIMGIINSTPDSFSGDGIHDNADEVVRSGVRMMEQGAFFLDIGGESTRPNAPAVSADEELRRVGPIVERLGARYPGRISVDTMKPQVADRTLGMGAVILNDVSGFRDPEMIEVAAKHDAATIVMHMQGTPRTMQLNPSYGDVVSDIIGFLRDRVDALERGGVDPRRIMVDPGIGFGKTLAHNLEILARLREFRTLGKPLVIGVSRKAFIGKVTGLPPEQRLGGSISATMEAAMGGADILRVHDVLDTSSALKVMQAIEDTRRTAVDRRMVG